MRSELKERIDLWFDDHRQELLDDLGELIAINSVRSEPLEGKPYGAGCARVLARGEDMCRRDGFVCSNFDNHVLTVDLNPAEPVLGILAHLDTVSVSGGWSSDPFKMRLSDGVLYGRGVSDDKGPAVAAYYALRAARELAPELKKGCRLILGASEETGSSDIAYYRTVEDFPPMVFTPDGNYPVVNFEKGRYAPRFEKHWAPETAARRIVSIRGGSTANIVPKDACALVTGFELEQIRSFAKAAEERLNVKTECEQCDGGIKISVTGASAHASTPESGVNAQTALLELLRSMPFDDCDSFRAVCALCELFPHADVSGGAIGIACADGETGALTLNFGVLELTAGGIEGNCDIRMPLCAGAQAVAEKFTAALARHGFSVASDSELTSYHYTPPESGFVSTLLDIYEGYTGQPGRCLAIGGGTYVHDIDGGVAFGCEMQGYDSRMHGDDERMPVDVLLLSARMFTMAIIELCS
ncbi:MAG: Sapep family Mn(2+)-dependent dipeptidase [Oscillospiraceae bacterium]|nr:Sapep family Mn(2+)-dependent dipeptidase [Oscillospiraceae bacterium]